jgi:hypothetical protein
MQNGLLNILAFFLISICFSVKKHSGLPIFPDTGHRRCDGFDLMIQMKDRNILWKNVKMLSKVIAPGMRRGFFYLEMARRNYG